MWNLLLPGALAEEAADAASEAAETTPSWGQELVGKFTETPGTVWIAVLVIIALGAALLAIGKSSKRWSTKTLAYGALCIALSFVLSCFRLYRQPQARNSLVSSSTVSFHVMPIFRTSRGPSSPFRQPRPSGVIFIIRECA